MKPIDIKPHSDFDLVLERTIDVPVELVWEAWTTPKHYKEWFCPKPWGVSDCRLDVRPGGECYVVMRSPEGQEFPNTGCYLEVIPNRRLVWTSALSAGYRPVVQPESGADMLFTACIELFPQSQGTRYVATAIHKDKTDCKSHADMGFHLGWGTCLDQLVTMVKSWKR